MRIVYIDDKPTPDEDLLIKQVAESLASMLGREIDYRLFKPDGIETDFAFFDSFGKLLKTPSDLPPGVSVKQLLRKTTIRTLADDSENFFLLDINFDELGYAPGLRNYGLDLANYLCNIKKIPRKRIFLFSSYPDHALEQERSRTESSWSDIYDKKQLLGSPYAVERLAWRLCSYFELELGEERKRILGEALASPDGGVGKSAAWKSVKELCFKYARATSPVLLQGESGTGKEVLARFVHNHSPRAADPFVTVNCAAINDELFESELFGHMKGSFTGAHADKKGLFEVADNGTLFLDEIGELNISVQAKLLRALREREIRRVGGTHDIPVDVRIVAATNRDLQRMVRDSLFREDLYYRVNVLQAKIPPLRDRVEDIPELINHFLSKYLRDGENTPYSLTPEAQSLILSYGWPGNVQQLQSAVERGVILCEDRQIDVSDLPEELWQTPHLDSDQLPNQVSDEGVTRPGSYAAKPVPSPRLVGIDKVRGLIEQWDGIHPDAHAFMLTLLNGAKDSIRAIGFLLSSITDSKERKLLMEAVKEGVKQVNEHQNDRVNVFENSNWIYAIAQLIQQWLPSEEQVHLTRALVIDNAPSNLNWEHFTGSQKTKNVRDWKTKADQGDKKYTYKREVFEQAVTQIIESKRLEAHHEISQDDFFYIIKDNYDEHIELAIPLYKTMHEEIVRLAPNVNGRMKVLDLGCGTGKTSSVILNHFPLAEVYGIDLFDVMLNHARVRLASFLDRVTLVRDDFREADFVDLYDLCISALAIHHSTSSEKRELFARIYEALKTNGRFVMIDWTKFRSQDMHDMSARFAEEHARKSIPGDKSEIVMDWVNHWREKNIPDSVEDMIGWLTDVGFSQAECVMRSYGMAMIWAEK